MNFKSVSLFCLIGLFSIPCSARTYPVRLSNLGPTATTIPIINKHLRTPTLERLPLRTTGCIPRPKTIDNVCTCYKTVVKPQVQNHIISVPSVQRVIQTTATPVIEKIHYEATPVDGPVCSYPAPFSTFTSVPYGFVKPACTSVVTSVVPSCLCRSGTILI